MDRTEREHRCGFDLYRRLASMTNFKCAPVSSFYHVPLSYRFDDNVKPDVFLEFPHREHGEIGETTYYWFVIVVDKRGLLVKLRFHGESDAKNDFWTNFLDLVEPVPGELEERVRPVGWAVEHGFKYQPPQNIRDAHQDWPRLLEELIDRDALTEKFDEIASEENESVFRRDMKMEATDINRMENLRPAVVRTIRGGRIELQYSGSNQTCWFHEYSDELRSEGWWSLIGRKITAPQEYRDESSRKAIKYEEPPGDDGATVYNHRPIFVSDIAAERLKNYRFRTGMTLEVVDPLRRGISVGTIVEVLKNQYLVIEINHRTKIRRHKKFKMCLHATSDLLLYAGFAKKFLKEPGDLEKYFNLPEGADDAENFSYDGRPTVSKDVLERMFPSNGFKEGHFLEVVGVRGSDEICISRIMRIVGHLLLIHYEDYGDEWDHFFPMTSLELFPTGYCHSMGQPLKRIPGEDWVAEFGEEPLNAVD